MKQKDVIKQIDRKGYYFLRHGANHDIYTNGKKEIPVPRHREINERTAREIIRQAEEK